MALSAVQLLEVRAWVGPESVIDDAALHELSDALGVNPLRVARQVLRQRIAELTAGPLEFAVEGDYSEKRAGQVEALQRLVAQLDAAIAVEDAAGGLSTSPHDAIGYLSRNNRDRLFGR